MIDFVDASRQPLFLYVSVKNRSDTLGGQDWPNSIAALEAVARTDNNTTGPYCCVFGVAMDRGTRRIPRERKSRNPHSVNTEVWLSDFFWPFFSDYSYEDIMTAMLEVLVAAVDTPDMLDTEEVAPSRVLNYFGEACAEAGLIDEQGNFDDPFKLVRFFCQKVEHKRRKRNSQ